MSSRRNADSYVIGIAGGSGSGKSWLARFLQEQLDGGCALVCQDWYYNDHSALPREEAAQVNFDHPHAFDTPLLIRQLDALRRGEAVEAPRYDFATHRRLGTKKVEGKPVIILEGILVLHEKRIRERLHDSIFVDTPADIRLMRRIERDWSERGIPVRETIRMYETFVRPMHERFIQPSATRAARIWDTARQRQFPVQLAAQLKRRIQ